MKISKTTWETLFVAESLPWMFDDLERLLASQYQPVDINVGNGTLSCTVEGAEKSCTEIDSFHNVWDSLFGMGALIVRGYYFELTADIAPIFQNEWDDQEKVLIKWYPGLPSLNTDLPYVAQTHADLLEKMLRLGIDGFRLDAVKHIPDTYFAELIEEVRDRLASENPEVDGEKILEKTSLRLW